MAMEEETKGAGYFAANGFPDFKILHDIFYGNAGKHIGAIKDYCNIYLKDNVAKQIDFLNAARGFYSFSLDVWKSNTDGSDGGITKEYLLIHDSIKKLIEQREGNLQGGFQPKPGLDEVIYKDFILQFGEIEKELIEEGFLSDQYKWQKNKKIFCEFLVVILDSGYTAKKVTDTNVRYFFEERYGEKKKFLSAMFKKSKSNDRLQRAILTAQEPHQVKMTLEARKLWEEIYEKLSTPDPGLLGSITSRAEAQVIRLALIYALLDCADSINTDHLHAAKAFWDYCHESAKYIFGKRFGDPVADTMLTIIKQHSGGMTSTELHRSFGNNKNKSKIERGLSVLLESRVIRTRQEKTSGRPTTYYEIN